MFRKTSPKTPSGNAPKPIRHRLFHTVAVAVIVAAALASQQQSLLKQHYDAAYSLQSQGRIPEADAEHTIFLTLALHQLAIGYANAGDYAHAEPLFAEALALAPENLALRKDYAEAAIDAQDPQKAQTLLENAFDNSSRQFPKPIQAEAHRVLGDSCLTRNQDAAALASYHAAYEIDPSYDSLYALAVATLTVKGYDGGAPLFAQLLTRFGNTAATHMAIAHAYGEAVLPVRAEEEYKKALALDPNIPGAHFGIGAALLNATNLNAAAAQAEFRKEVALHPDDAMSWYELGALAAADNASEAETDLKRSVSLNPQNPDVWMELGKLYTRQQRPQDAEPAFRQAIALTPNPARNNWAIERAHFSLGRILQAAGKKDEAAKEFAISAQMLNQKRGGEEDSMKGQRAVNTSLHRSRGATPEEREQLHDFEQNIAPLIAAGYNNLGVHAAMASDFRKAEGDFAHAAKWNPDLHGVDGNWGRAAYEAHDYEQAVAPLERASAANPQDPELRTMLAESKQRATAKTN